MPARRKVNSIGGNWGQTGIVWLRWITSPSRLALLIVNSALYHYCDELTIIESLLKRGLISA